MSALLQTPREARLEPLVADWIPAVCDVERSVYTHPWSASNFADSLAAGYHCQCLVGPADAGTAGEARPMASESIWRRFSFGGRSTPGIERLLLLGYFIAMKGVDEVHLLNVTVAPAYQRQGWAHLMLEALCLWSRGQGVQWLWLEARESNLRAIEVYQRFGFRRVGLRKGYYPAVGAARENAVVMSLRLNESPSAWGGLT